MISFRKVLRNSSYLLGFRILSRLLSIVFLVYAASRLSPESFGALSFTLITLELVVTLGDLGITRYGARELVRFWDDRAVLLGRILSVQVITSLALVAAAVPIVFALTPSTEKLQLMLLAVSSFFFYSFINTAESAFIASQRFFYSALLSFVGRLAYTVFGLAVLVSRRSIVLVMWGFLASVVLEAVIRVAVVRKLISRLSMRFSVRDALSMLRLSFPFAVAGFASVVTYRGNVFVLEFLRGDAEVGVFNAAFSLFSPLVMVAIIFSSTIYPGLTAAFHKDPDGARKSCWQWFRLIALASVPVVVAVSLLAGRLADFFPAGYEDIQPVLIILMWTVPFTLVLDVDFNVLQVNDLEAVAARSVVIGAIASPLFSLILIPFIGIYGAAVAMLLATLIREVYCRYKVRRSVMNERVASLFVRPVIAAAVMAAVGLAVLRVNPWIAVTLGLLAYASLALVMGVVRPEEIKSLFLKPAAVGVNGTGEKYRKVP